jgi:O-antigen/teichoic acid export membrane protein
MNNVKNGKLINGIRYLKSYELNNPYIYLIGNLSVAVAPLIIFPLLTRLLSKQDFAEISLYTAVYTMCCCIIGVGLSLEQNRIFIKFGERSKDYIIFKKLSISTIMLNTVLAISLVVFLYKTGIIDSIRIDYLVLAIVNAFLSVVISLLMNEIRLKSKGGLYCILQIVQAILNVLICLILIYFTELKVEAKVISISIVFVIVTFIFFKNIIGWLESDFKLNLKDIIEFYNDKMKLAPHILGIFLVSSADRMVISNIIGLSEFSDYAVAIQMAALLYIVYDAIEKYYIPKLFLIVKNSEYNEVVNFLYKYALFSIALSTLLYLFSDTIIISIAGVKYINSVPVFNILVFGALFFSISNIYAHLYIYYDEKISLSRITIIHGIIQLILIYFLCSLFGLKGAALGFLFGHLIKLLLLIYKFTNFIKLPYANVFFR